MTASVQSPKQRAELAAIKPCMSKLDIEALSEHRAEAKAV